MNNVRNGLSDKERNAPNLFFIFQNRRSGRDDKRNVSPVHRPSNPPTLFDFVQTKVPISDGPREQDYVPDFAKVELILEKIGGFFFLKIIFSFTRVHFQAEKVEAGERHDDQQGVYRAGRNKYIDKGIDFTRLFFLRLLFKNILHMLVRSIYSPIPAFYPKITSSFFVQNLSVDGVIIFIATIYYCFVARILGLDPPSGVS